jgi:uncharacterized membrane protein YphA (DoxX/SURF4 family)
VFIYDTSQLQSIIEQSTIGELSTFAHIAAGIVGISTLAAGMFIMVGLFTRPASYVQIGVVAAALVFLTLTNIHRSVLEVMSTFVVLLLLVFYAVKGSGSISFDKEMAGA